MSDVAKLIIQLSSFILALEQTVNALQHENQTLKQKLQEANATELKPETKDDKPK